MRQCATQDLSEVNQSAEVLRDICRIESGMTCAGAIDFEEFAAKLWWGLSSRDAALLRYYAADDSLQRNETLVLEAGVAKVLLAWHDGGATDAMLGGLRRVHQLHTLHKHSDNHREQLLAAGRGACFHCISRFASSELREWIDKGQTALCPRCGIDAVLVDSADNPIQEGVLVMMEEYWFGMPKRTGRANG